jgi:hypothetical protein
LLWMVGKLLWKALVSTAVSVQNYCGVVHCICEFPALWTVSSSFVHLKIHCFVIFRPRKSVRYEEHGSIMRHVVLKGISAQLMSAAVRERLLLCTSPIMFVVFNAGISFTSTSKITTPYMGIFVCSP